MNHQVCLYYSQSLAFSVVIDDCSCLIKYDSTIIISFYNIAFLSVGCLMPSTAIILLIHLQTKPLKYLFIIIQYVLQSENRHFLQHCTIQDHKLAQVDFSILIHHHSICTQKVKTGMRKCFSYVQKLTCMYKRVTCATETWGF